MMEDGVLSGDSRFSTASVGRASAGHVVDCAAGFVEHFRTQDPGGG